MRTWYPRFRGKKTARGEKLHILGMLRAQRRHISFHTPGHKRGGADITELSYSDNLASPAGVIAEAQADLARITGAAQSFLLTDGSTSGVHAMLHALASRGIRRVACPERSHRSVATGCELAGLVRGPVFCGTAAGIPLQPTAKDAETALSQADALLVTSPDYYGNFPDLAALRALCDRENKPLVIDGAHGAHLHGTPLYAGRYADMWVDGVHKSLPALTQGALVSAGSGWTDALASSVGYFRTTSPSYPIMASVEYAVKYPRNAALEEAAQALKARIGAYPNADWSKLLLPFGDRADAAQAALERQGIYPEFNDGNYLMFYLSPATTRGELKTLERALRRLPRGTLRTLQAERGEIPLGARIVALPPAEAEGRVCAADCGLFPPCIPLILRGERVGAAQAALLQRAGGTFGLQEGKIPVFEEA